MADEFKTTCKDYGDRRGCGATITMKKEDGKWHAYNTDGSRHTHEDAKLVQPIPQAVVHDGSPGASARATFVTLVEEARELQEKLFPNTQNKDAAILGIANFLQRERLAENVVQKETRKDGTE